MAKLSSSAMHNKGLCVLSQIGRRTSGVNFFLFVQYMVYCFTTKRPNFQVVLCIIKAYVCFHILAEERQVLTFFVCSVYDVLRG